jgi:hypothetical protein
MNTEFHKPFIRSLIIVAVFTIFSMVTSHFIVDFYMSKSLKSPIFTSQESYISSSDPQ